MASTLDEQFGPAINPKYLYDCEMPDRAPSSLSKLDVPSARSLKRHMDEIAAGWRLGRVLHYDILVIWLVDEAGDVRFAIEELVWKGIPTGRPKFRNLGLTERMPKLGHPCLVQCK